MSTVTNTVSKKNIKSRKNNSKRNNKSNSRSNSGSKNSKNRGFDVKKRTNTKDKKVQLKEVTKVSKNDKNIIEMPTSDEESLPIIVPTSVPLIEKKDDSIDISPITPSEEDSATDDQEESRIPGITSSLKVTAKTKSKKKTASNDKVACSYIIHAKNEELKAPCETKASKDLDGKHYCSKHYTIMNNRKKADVNHKDINKCEYLFYEGKENERPCTTKIYKALKVSGNDVSYCKTHYKRMEEKLKTKTSPKKNRDKCVYEINKKTGEKVQCSMYQIENSTFCKKHKDIIEKRTEKEKNQSDEKKIVKCVYMIKKKNSGKEQQCTTRALSNLSNDDIEEELSSYKQYCKHHARTMLKRSKSDKKSKSEVHKCVYIYNKHSTEKDEHPCKIRSLQDGTTYQDYCKTHATVMENKKQREKVEKITCEYTFKAGDHQGEKCGKKASKGSKLCSRHSPKKEDLPETSDISSIIPKSAILKTKEQEIVRQEEVEEQQNDYQENTDTENSDEGEDVKIPNMDESDNEESDNDSDDEEGEDSDNDSDDEDSDNEEDNDSDDEDSDNDEDDILYCSDDDDNIKELSI